MIFCLKNRIRSRQIPIGNGIWISIDSASADGTVSVNIKTDLMEICLYADDIYENEKNMYITGRNVSIYVPMIDNTLSKKIEQMITETDSKELAENLKVIEKTLNTMQKKNADEIFIIHGNTIVKDDLIKTFRTKYTKELNGSKDKNESDYQNAQE